MKKILTIYTLFSFICVIMSQMKADNLAVDNFLNTPGLESASVGISVIDLETGKTIVDINQNKSLIPASTLKVLSTATVLDMFGADEKIPTEIYYSGKITNQILYGDIIIKGYGDPSIESKYNKGLSFDDYLIDAIKKKGIKKITGSIISDETFFPTEGVQPSWLWEDIGNYYAAGSYGLNYRDNSYDLILDTSKKNTKPTVIKTEPYIPGMIFENYLSDKNIPFDSAYIYGAPFSDKRFITGAVPHKNNRFIIKGDIPDPSEFMAYSIKSLLEKNGVEVEGKYTSARRIFLEKKKLPADLHLLATYYSPSVSSLSRIANELSNNLYAEALMKYSASKAGKGNDMQQISSFIKDYWKNKGINTDALFIYDGNGLSPSDRITPTFFTSLLFYMKDNKAFIESLPIAGSEGTVKNFLKDQSLRNKFRLKSGTIKQVVAYTGYISDDQTEKNINQKYAVSVIINNHTCNYANLRKAIEKMFVDLKL